MRDKNYIIGYRNNYGNDYFDVYVQEMHSYDYVYRDRVRKNDLDGLIDRLKIVYKNSSCCFFKY